MEAKVARLAGVSEKTVYNTLSGKIRGPKSRKVIEAYRIVFAREDEEDLKQNTDMETRRYINVRTWSENWFETLSASEKLVWIYLNTNSSTNMLGVYSMTVRRIAYECHISEPAARRNIKKLEDIKN